MSKGRHDSSDGAQRWASILVGAAVLGFLGWLTIEAQSNAPRPAAPKQADAGVAPVSSASATDAGAGVLGALGGPGIDGTPPPGAIGIMNADSDGGLFLTPPTIGSLPAGAPRSVKLGVVLVTYAGAEGAPANARSKAAARELADRLAGDAKTDFHKAVGGGDPGSANDIGRLQRGILDPRTEVAVFNLTSGEVSDVLETARGFWIVKRID